MSIARKRAKVKKKSRATPAKKKKVLKTRAKAKAKRKVKHKTKQKPKPKPRRKPVSVNTKPRPRPRPKPTRKPAKKKKRRATKRTPRKPSVSESAEFLEAFFSQPAVAAQVRDRIVEKGLAELRRGMIQTPESLIIGHMIAAEQLGNQDHRAKELALEYGKTVQDIYDLWHSPEVA